jgi:hypothetical protein
LPYGDEKVSTDVAALIQAWPYLSPEQRAAILSIARQQSADAPSLPDPGSCRPET